MCLAYDECSSMQVLPGFYQDRAYGETARMLLRTEEHVPDIKRNNGIRRQLPIF